jgi:hypothetical protein
MSELWASITPHSILMYGIAAGGSLGVELLAFVREISTTGRVPIRYRQPWFVLGRVLFAVVAAGPLAIILDATSKVSALYIGISAPLIYDRLAAGMDPIPAIGNAEPDEQIAPTQD